MGRGRSRGGARRDDDRSRRCRRDAAEPFGDRDPAAHRSRRRHDSQCRPARARRDGAPRDRRSPAGHRHHPARAESDRRSHVCRRAARHLGDRRRGRWGRDCGGQHALRGAGRREPALGAGREHVRRSEPRCVLRAARARGRRAGQPRVPGAGGRRHAAVHLERGSPRRTGRGVPALDPRPRAPRARAAWRPTRGAAAAC